MRHAVALFFCAALAPGWAQTAPPAATAPAAASTPAASASANTQRVEVTGGRLNDTEQRRQSTAAKIVIGREEIDKFGDANVGEVLRRLPGVTTPGAPGRGGLPRMRGLGSGYTRLLIDGQPLPPGFSLDSLTPEQVERIEILRAPTAETGAQAIAGTINIILREGFQRRLNDLRIGSGVENGQPSAGVFWSHNDNAGKLTYTLSAGLFANRRKNESTSDTEVTAVDGGALLEDRSSRTVTRGEGMGLNLNARLQWRLGAAGDSLILMPGVFSNRNHNNYAFATDERLRRDGVTPEFAASGSGSTDNSFTGPRLTLQYRQRVGDWRLEGGGTLRASRATSDAHRDERRGDGSELRTQIDRTVQREKGLQLNLKGSTLLGGEGSEHNFVGGAEIEAAQRKDTRSTVETGRVVLDELGDDFEASTLRTALWAQDEWSLNPHWAFHGGLRWEGISTRGDAGQGVRPSNRNRVTTPLLHLLWKPDPKTKDQVRLSLTRSWRAPTTSNLIGRPVLNRVILPPAENTEQFADSAGNPELKPELATGIDLAYERYLEGGGLLSANVFSRRITDLMRAEARLEAVPYSPNPRWVRRTRNIGDASAQGIELEAKFRLNQLLAGSAPVELRANLALFRSSVDSVPGPDNRLDQQSKASGNLGADYRFRSLPLTLGGNLNWVPSTLVRLDADQTTRGSTKRQWDLFALWTFNPSLALRLMGNNLLARDFATETVNDAIGFSGIDERTHNVGTNASYISWQMRLELKL